jgi:uncharacterized protein YutD
MDENHAQESYFQAFSSVINDLDPAVGDFEFQYINLRNAVQISHLLTPGEKEDLKSMLHIIYTRSRG